MAKNCPCAGQGGLCMKKIPGRLIKGRYGILANEKYVVFSTNTLAFAKKKAKQLKGKVVDFDALSKKLKKEDAK